MVEVQKIINYNVHLDYIYVKKKGINIKIMKNKKGINVKIYVKKKVISVKMNKNNITKILILYKYYKQNFKKNT